MTGRASRGTGDGTAMGAVVALVAAAMAVAVWASVFERARESLPAGTACARAWSGASP